MRQTHVPHITLVSSTYHIIGSMYVSQFHSVRKKDATNWSPTNITVFVGVRSKEKTATLIGETWWNSNVGKKRLSPLIWLKYTYSQTFLNSWYSWKDSPPSPSTVTRWRPPTSGKQCVNVAILRGPQEVIYSENGPFIDDWWLLNIHKYMYIYNTHIYI